MRVPDHLRILPNYSTVLQLGLCSLLVWLSDIGAHLALYADLWDECLSLRFCFNHLFDQRSRALR